MQYIEYKPLLFPNLGKLHSELGLLYINMGQFDSALQSFEQSLILVQKGRRTSTSLQDEASILQNIGAAYNEKGMFPEAVAYHKEAAALHGQLLFMHFLIDVMNTILDDN